MAAKTDGTPRFFRGRQFAILSMDNFDQLSRAMLIREFDDTLTTSFFYIESILQFNVALAGEKEKARPLPVEAKGREREITAPKRRTQVQSLQMRSFNQRSTTPSLKNEQNIS